MYDIIMNNFVRRMVGIRFADELIKPITDYQQDLEFAFKLDCSLEDIKQDKEAAKLNKEIKKSRKYVDKIKKITEKLVLK